MIDPEQQSRIRAKIAELGKEPERIDLYTSYIQGGSLWRDTCRKGARPWSVARQLVRERDRSCQMCPEDSLDAVYHVHHRRYQPEIPDMWSYGIEPLDILILLCRACHHAIHDYGGWPKFRNKDIDRIDLTLADSPSYQNPVPIIDLSESWKLALRDAPPVTGITYDCPESMIDDLGGHRLSLQDSPSTHFLPGCPPNLR